MTGGEETEAQKLQEGIFLEDMGDHYTMQKGSELAQRNCALLEVTWSLGSSFIRAELRKPLHPTDLQTVAACESEFRNRVHFDQVCLTWAQALMKLR